MRRTTRWTATCAIVLAVMAGRAQAGLLLTIDRYTTDELTFSIHGAFDADTIGDREGFLAIKNDWTSHQGVHTEMFAFTPTITANTISIGGVAPVTNVQNFSETWADDIHFVNPLGPDTPILAGTTVDGSVTLHGVGAFDPIANNHLELLSGILIPFAPDVGPDWARLETGEAPPIVPEPLSLALWGVLAAAGMGLTAIRRR